MVAPQQDEPIRELARQVGLMAEEQRNANRIQLHRLFAEQLDRAINDPSFADVLGVPGGVSPERRRQLAFANKQYGLILLSYRIGGIDRGELLGSLRYLSRSPEFAEYCQRTSEARSVLPKESLEARIGRAIDAVMEERLDDLEEWWVIGPGSEA
jgi:hypothetical protein